MRTRSHTFLLLLLSSLPLPAATPAFQQRVNFVIDTYAHPKPARPLDYHNIAAKLKLHEDAALCSRRLEELLAAGPTGDMFWMFPITAVAYLDQGQLSDSARLALRRSFKTYMPYRGDTENHWLLYYTSLYLMSQLWPDLEGDQWYTGKSSAENMREAAGWIESWVRLTTTRGQGEYDSPHYMGLYFLSMSYLAEWAKDPAMKQRARMMLEYLIADYAAENLDGIFVGAHSRVYDRPAVEKWFNVSSDFGWVLFGLGRPMEPPGSYIICYLLASAYEPPEILKRIATDRDQPYTHYELKRTRNRWRFFDELHGPVYKTTYMRREYAVGSDQGGTLQPIQEHSWDVTWNVPDARGVQNTFFTLHPYSSLRELQTYFTFPPDPGLADVVSSKKSYDSPDKLVGGSPYEQIFQDQDTVIVLYDIPAGDALSAHQRLLLQGSGRSARRPLGLDLRARRRRLHRLPSAAAVYLETDRGRRPAAVQPLPEERDGGAGGGALGIRGTWTHSGGRFSRCRSKSGWRPRHRCASARCAARCWRSPTARRRG